MNSCNSDEFLIITKIEYAEIVKNQREDRGIPSVWKDKATEWMLMSFQKSCINILTSKTMVFGDRAFARWLGYEGKASMNGIRVLIKKG